MEWLVSPARMAGAASLLAGYAALCAGVAWQVRGRRRQEAAEAHMGGQGPGVLVAYASQTGQAQAVARATAQMLGQAGFQVLLQPVEHITAALLQSSPRSVWVLSTTGEGDAPDHALSFMQQVLPHSCALQRHSMQVLALGDREYAQFCSFGQQVHDWLQTQGANGPLTCVDNMHPATLQAWQGQMEQQLQQWAAAAGVDAMAPQGDWLLPTPRQRMRLQRRQLLNPGSSAGGLYVLDWVAEQGALPDWEAGDLVSLAVPADPERPRDYSIASTPADGCLQLLVRESLRVDGSPGLASGWLCTGMAEGDVLEMAVRAHPGFRLESNAERPLILIGNGSGLAGLRAHIKARVQRGLYAQWLVYGERSPRHDAICGEELQAWLEQGKLERLDLAWSREVPQRRYVQDVLLQQAEPLRDWVARGAAIYVCGSMQGMGQGVHQALEQVLGADALQDLQRSGRYRRDVY
ncbi:MAG: sulfite reductase subunit alpha [Acidovorax sp.]|jgi:sulfite reductase (NADPH) flavoprotein alpha-component|nr:sulfite reductase subunit alpha [Acidovorax sp.]